MHPEAPGREPQLVAGAVLAPNPISDLQRFGSRSSLPVGNVMQRSTDIHSNAPGSTWERAATSSRSCLGSKSNFRSAKVWKQIFFTSRERNAAIHRYSQQCTRKHLGESRN